MDAEPTREDVEMPLIINAIHRYRRLKQIERDDRAFRCGFLMENGMQCPLNGYIELLDKGYFLCSFHSANAMAVADSKHETYTEVKE